MKQILIAIDQLFNALFGGWADETLSSRTWRQQHRKTHWRILRMVIDALFFWEADHCRCAYESELDRSQLPPEFRRVK